MDKSISSSSSAANLSISYSDLPFSKEHFIIAIDIGGTLAKLTYSPWDSNSFRFDKCETEKIDHFINLIHTIIKTFNNSIYENVIIVATGGGAFKFEKMFNSNFNNINSFKIFDEMDCLINGLNFFINDYKKDEVFTYSDDTGFQTVDNKQNVTYPYLLVNIGSGVSMLKVDSPNTFTRVGGSSLGGGTLWGLLSLITGAKTYDQMLDWAQAGDNSSVDMLVKDIYGDGGALEKLGLNDTAIASSFAKCFQRNGKNDNDERPNKYSFKKEDICKSLLFAISNNIGQIAYLQAKINNIPNIYFGGSYIRNHLTTMNTLSFAIKFWSNGDQNAFFLKHEGYLGAMGAYLFSITNKQ